MAEKKLNEFCDILWREKRSAEDRLSALEMELGNGNRCLGAILRMTLTTALEENSKEQPEQASSPVQALEAIEEKYERFLNTAKNHISHQWVWSPQLMELLASLCRFIARGSKDEA